jgi:hypothetical protein
MRPLSEVFLAEGNISTGDKTGKDVSLDIASIGTTGEPKSAKTTEYTTQTISGIPLKELELNYLKNSTVFNAVNKTTQVIMYRPPKIVAKDQKVKAYFEEFTKNLGNSGSNTTWPLLLTTIFQHQFIYGRSFVENIMNTRKNRIVDWDTIDPKKMDYARDSNSKIVLDKYNNPVGYFEIIPSDEGGKGNPNAEKAKGTVINSSDMPNGIVPPAGQNSIYFPAIRIAHMKLYTVGDGFFGVGIVEPIYRNSLQKLNLEDAQTSAGCRHANPVIWAQLGDLNHEPTPQQIENMTKKLKDMTYKSEISTPYYYNLQILESKKSGALKEQLSYCRSQELTGLGIPGAFVTGEGDANFATLGKQALLWQLTLIDLINRTKTAIEKQMFLPLCKL